MRDKSFFILTTLLHRLVASVYETTMSTDFRNYLDESGLITDEDVNKTKPIITVNGTDGSYQ